MARAADRIPENAGGDFFVDSSCIDCDLCRQLAPAVFGRVRAQSYVAAQPVDAAAEHRALMALVTCPTSSIGTTRKLDARRAAAAFPELVADDVYFCGYASAASYGAAAWLVRRPAGNVLVDSPRWSTALADRIAALGGVRHMFLTHRDDVADHAAYHARFGCERIIHRADAAAAPDAERVLDGDAPIDLAPDLRAVPVPGHTRGSMVLVAGERFAFTGDHVWADDGVLEAGRDVCWFSWDAQRSSMLRLANERFVHLLPGHGRPYQAASVEAMQNALRALAAVM